MLHMPSGSLYRICFNLSISAFAGARIPGSIRESLDVWVVSYMVDL